MKIYRGPQSKNELTLTASKTPRQYLKTWHPGSLICFDGAIAATERFTTLGVVIEEDDVVGLSDTLIKNLRRDKRALEREINMLRKQISQLRDGMHKIDRLLQSHAAEAPSRDALLHAAHQIAFYHLWNAKGKKPKVGWIKYDSI